ncbi:MAG TPA: hypothetical protein VL326_00435 [Kofleriaceae bacterium]|nr:hypothetical protein [Kofleriaceae bacterium]
MRAAWLLAAVTACSFQHGSLGPGSNTGDDASGGGDDARLVDASTIDTPPAVTCFAKWKAGPTFSDPIQFGIATTSDEGDPFLTADEKTMYFLRTGDIYKTTRTSLANDFATDAKASDLSSGQIDSKGTLTHDGLTVFFDTARTGGTGGATDLWRATRSSTTNTFGTPNQMYLGALNTSGDQWDPHASWDGLRLYLSPQSATGQHIVMASRPSTTDSFAAPVPLPELDSTASEADPTLTIDERLIVFTSNRSGSNDMYYATRDEPTLPFGAPILVPTLNTNNENGPFISNDGCRLYFVSNRDTDFDIWETDVQ